MTDAPISEQQVVDFIRTKTGDRPLENLTLAAATSDALGRLGDDVVTTFVEEARGAGMSWSQIGTSLGMTRQAAQQRSSRTAKEAPFGIDGIRNKPSPFSGVEERDGVIHVQVEMDGGWYRLLEIDGRTVDEVVAASRRHFKGRWFKRLSEDLDDVFAALGAELGPTAEVTLVDAADRRHQRVVDVTIAKRKAALRHNHRDD